MMFINILSLSGDVIILLQVEYVPPPKKKRVKVENCTLILYYIHILTNSTNIKSFIAWLLLEQMNQKNSHL